MVISTEQTLLLDMDTPVLFFLLIDGGTVIFDDKDLHLQAEHILITKNGSLMVGTEENRFQHKVIITLHGNVTSQELPVYGAKSISLRTGYLGLHGQHILNTWTRLSQTAEPGATEIHVTVAVPDWKVGSEIVIASTSKSLRENEAVFITGVTNNGNTIQIDRPLAFKHIALTQTIAGRTIETAAEVCFKVFFFFTFLLIFIPELGRIYYSTILRLFTSVIIRVSVFHQSDNNHLFIDFLIQH